MEETFFIIRCWSRSRKGTSSLLVELHQAKDMFRGLRQSESDLAIQSLRDQGRIDPSSEYQSFSVPSQTILGWLSELHGAPIPAVPPPTFGFGGKNCYVEIQHGETFLRHSWWLDCPSEWKPLELFWQRVVALPGT